MAKQEAVQRLLRCLEYCKNFFEKFLRFPLLFWPAEGELCGDRMVKSVGSFSIGDFPAYTIKILAKTITILR